MKGENERNWQLFATYDCTNYIAIVRKRRKQKAEVENMLNYMYTFNLTNFLISMNDFIYLLWKKNNDKLRFAVSAIAGYLLAIEFNEHTWRMRNQLIFDPVRLYHFPFMFSRFCCSKSKNENCLITHTPRGNCSTQFKLAR